MVLIVKVRGEGNALGVKEDLVYRIEQVADVERVDILTDAEYRRIFK